MDRVDRAAKMIKMIQRGIDVNGIIQTGLLLDLEDDDLNQLEHKLDDKINSTELRLLRDETRKQEQARQRQQGE
jgi:hypothetical protein